MLTEITGDTKGLAGKHELYIFPDLQFWLFTALEVSLVMFMSLDAPWFDQLPGYFITCNSMPTSSIGVPTGVTWGGAGFPSNNPVTTKTFLCITSTLLDSDCVQIAILCAWHVALGQVKFKLVLPKKKTLAQESCDCAVEFQTLNILIRWNLHNFFLCKGITHVTDNNILIKKLIWL